MTLGKNPTRTQQCRASKPDSAEVDRASGAERALQRDDRGLAREPNRFGEFEPVRDADVSLFSSDAERHRVVTVDEGA